MERPAKLQWEDKAKCLTLIMLIVPGLKCGPLTPCGCRSHPSTSKQDAKGDFSGFPPDQWDNSQIQKLLCV